MIKENNCDLEDSAVYEYAFGHKFFARMIKVFIALFVVVAAFSLTIIYLYVNYTNINVIGTSMQNTLNNGDRVIIRKTNDVERGDIVVINVEDYDGGDSFTEKYIIKRVIALGGDEVYCEDGVVYLKKSGESDFTPLTEEYASSKTPSFSTVKVEEGEFYFLGDNRSISRDSTELGCMSIEKIYGKVPSWAITIKGFTSFLYG